MGTKPEPALTRRERQIMDVVYAREAEVTAREIWASIADPPSYSTVRTLLAVLLEKGQLTAERKGKALFYTPTRARATAAKGALQRLVDTFFGGSVEAAVLGLVDLDEEKLTANQAKALREAIDDHRQEGGQ